MRILAVLAAVWLVSGIAQAQSEVRRDVLLIERIDKSDQLSQPARGSTMNQVRGRFGEPNSITAAVGSPPIARWHYDEITVYFEHQWVIDSVANRLSETETLVQAE